MIAKKLLLGRPFVAVYDNDIDAFIPEFWANESLAILEENMVIANLVHRDFEDIIQNFGDIINTRRPGEFRGVRKTNADNVTVQDATATNVQVPLNQHLHVSFLIKDGEESKSMKSLIDEYMAPSMLAEARFVDQVLLGQVYRYLANAYGYLGNMTSADVVERTTGTRNKMNINKAYVTGRNLILTPNTETTFLNNSQFTDANRIGDDGTALREASLGRKFGFDIFMCQNASSVATGNTGTTGAINLAAGYPAGTTTALVNGFSAAIANNSWITIGGQPVQVVSTVGGATPTSITFTPALSKAVLDDAVVQTYTAGTVNLTAGYAAGWAKEITVATFTVAPQVGQMVTFGTQTHRYSILQVTGLTSILLDRPLEAAITDTLAVNLGPAGEYNFAFHKNALALVVRPLAMPRAGTGALSSVVNMNGLSIRATITYDGNKQGHLVTLDMLFGIAILNEDLGAALLA